MMPARRVAMIGYGAQGRYIAHALRGDGSGVALAWVLVRPGRQNAARDAVGPGPRIITSLEELDARPDLVVEVAGHGALVQYGAAVLAAGFDLATVSIGALADGGLAAKLEAAGAQGGTLRLLSGAVGALDALAAAREGGLERVTYTGRKPPRGWAGSPAQANLDLETLDRPATHFTGTARQAARDYPKNANVAAAVALAGVGLDETAVELVADPGIDGNIHQIVATGAFGRLDFTIAGRPLPNNPRSSALTAMCVVRAIRDLARPVRLG